MFFVVVFWLPIGMSAFATFMVFVLQCHIFGIIYVCDVELSLMVIVALTVTCGICIDEITHSMYGIVYSYGTVEERLHEMIVGHGPSIMKGAISTMLGVSMLGGSDSPFWQTFFYIIFFLCLLGSIMGIVIVPSVLALFMEDNPHPDDLCFADDFDDDKHQVEMGNIGADGFSVVDNQDSHAASSFKGDSSASGLQSRVD
jgi:predicted RND superfamily exporter protein